LDCRLPRAATVLTMTFPPLRQDASFRSLAFSFFALDQFVVDLTSKRTPNLCHLMNDGKAVKTFSRTSRRWRPKFRFNLRRANRQRQRAQKEGGNATINIVSYYKKDTFSSATEYERHAGNIIAGVALKATIVKLKN
jgi:hypothetical protein